MVSRYRNIFPHHVNTIPHLFSANENHLKSREVEVYTLSGSFRISYLIKIYIPLTFLFTVTIQNNVLSPPHTSYFVLYNTLEFDVALAHLPMATVTITVVEMMKSLVLDHENKKLILRPLNLVHEVDFNEK